MKRLLLSFALVACAHEGSLDRSKPTGRTPDTVSVDEVPVKGFDAEVELLSDKTFRGEILAVDDASVYILDHDKTLAIPRTAVKTIAISLLTATGLAAGIWTAAGTVSTLTHGGFLIISAPLWLATGIPATAAASSHESQVSAASPELGRIYQFARFPQGLPAGWPYVPVDAQGKELTPARR
jgi:hypothetical protein